MESGATATATLVISKSLAGRIRSNTPASLIVSEVGTGEILSVPLDLATIEFREVSTLPNFGQAAIDFEIWLVSGEQPTSPVVLRITNGAVLLGEVALVGAGERGFEIKATIADSSATLPLQVRQPAETGSNENGSDSG
jgi:hypothetical protein